MTVPFELDEVRDDLEALLGDVLRSVFEEEADVLPEGFDAPDPGPEAGVPATSLLAIADDTDGSRLGVRVRISGRLAHVLASRMFGSDDPGSEDLLDAVGELGNIAGGNVKALLFFSSGTARLSLPSASLVDDTSPAVAQGAPPVTVRALVLGDLAELTLIPNLEGEGLIWPPVLRPEVLEGQP